EKGIEGGQPIAKIFRQQPEGFHRFLPGLERLLPLEVPEARGEELIHEPALPELLDHTARLYLLGRVFGILLEAKASEQAIRRQTMKAATDNADDLIEKLTLLYNKARQHGITAELADIMGGAEALREGR
ncbi:TPA: F0F1 ATP synthase subunit gamma, partial [Candidatus Bipolaricaulota bacterium]|nr:F0F1 ATP synthase subunit gamma [Candidatus Bipolaricaulota bacterium]